MAKRMCLSPINYALTLFKETFNAMVRSGRGDGNDVNCWLAQLTAIEMDGSNLSPCETSNLWISQVQLFGHTA